MKVRVQDSTGESIFAIFHKDACALFNKTAAELFEEEDKVYSFRCLSFIF